MSNWLFRLDEVQVTRDDVVGKLSQRIRVAWLWYQLSAIASMLSRHYLDKIGLAKPLRIAKRYWESGEIHLLEIAETLVCIEKASESLVTFEGYPSHLNRTGITLLFSIIDPDPRQDVKFGDPVCRLPIDPEVIHNHLAYQGCIAAATTLVSDLGMCYADLQLWWQGVQFDPSYEEYYDELQSEFFQFSQKCFNEAVNLRECERLCNPFQGIVLNWNPPRPLLEIAPKLRSKAPPLHERVKPHVCEKKY